MKVKKIPTYPIYKALACEYSVKIMKNPDGYCANIRLLVVLIFLNINFLY